MIYNFNSQDILNSNIIDEFYTTNITLKDTLKKRRNIFILYSAIVMVLGYATLVLLTGDVWRDTFYKPFIIGAILCIFLTLIIPQIAKNGLKTAYKKIKNHSLEITEEGLYYKNDNSKLNLKENKMKLFEICKYKDFTILHYKVPTKKKSLEKYYPLIIPKKIFTNEKEYNNFIIQLEN